MKVTIQDSKTSVTVRPRDFKVTVSGARGPQGDAGVGIAAGGTEGQILAKASATDYDTEWIDNYAVNVEVYVKNSSGSPMTKGQVVYISGADGTNPTISLAIATSEMGSSKTIGWLKQDLTNGAFGYVITEGLLEGINTNAATAAGDTIWLSPTTAGSVVYGIANKPSAPNHLVFLGYVLRKQINNGKIYVKVQNGFELGELHDVYNGAKTTPVGDDALLLRDSADSNLWKRLTWTNALAGVKSHMDTFKSVAGGYASLDGSGKVPASELPSYVDDVVEVANYAALPGTGETGKIYVTLDTNKCYRWSGSVYVQVAQGVDTLTTTGTSGAATLVGSTLNIPQYQGVLTNPVTGTGTAGQVSYWSGTNTQTGSQDFTWNDTTKILSFSNGGTLINEIRISSVNSNTMMGRLAGSSASLSGGSNSFFGQNSGSANTTGNGNSAFGLRSGNNNTTGSGNVFFGSQAGRYLADGTTSLTVTNNSVFLGFDTRAAADSQTNQIAIGYQAIGLGSNTTVIGNSSTTQTWLGGNLTLGTTTSGGRLTVRGSGTTSATTALLVQNSTPSELFKVTDDGQTTLSPIANTSALVSSNYSVTGSGTTPLINLSGTWNTTGLPSLITSNITDTASNAFSNLMLFRINGTQAFRVTKDGGIYMGDPGVFGGGIRPNGLTLNIASGVNGSSVDNDFNFASALGVRSHTSGTSNVFQIRFGASQAFAPTSGTGVLNIINIPTTINQTGGANGITRGLYVNPTLTAAADWRSVEFSNNTGWGLYGAGTANNYLGGGLGIGSTAVTGYSLHLGKPMTGGVTTFGVMNEGVIQSDSTTSARYFMTLAATQAASFTVGNLFHYIASQGTFGLNSTVTAQYGFYAASQLTGATNNYGFYGDIASGTGRWNLYMNGTAANYLAGNTSIGTTTSSGRLTVQGSGTTSATKAFVVNNSTPTAIFEVLDNGRINQTIPGASNNTIFGTGAGASASLSGSFNTFYGVNAGVANTTGASNSLIGYNAGAALTTGGSNVYVGSFAGFSNQSATTNTGAGTFAMLNHTTGGDNIGQGFNAARFYADGTTSATSFSLSTYLGAATRVSGAGVTNEIAIGHSAIGNGSNTATLGNTSITATYLRGNINYTDGGNFVIGTTTGTKIGTSTSQKIGLWNATPIVQPTTAVAAATRVGGGGTTVTDTDTFDGYTIAQLVKALRNMGALA